MATWQQGINSGGFLAGIGAQNENAPKASDINATLGLIRENNDLARSGANNVALTGLRGLAGVADIYKQEQQQKALNAFNQVHANAWATGDPSGLFKFAQENPAFVAQAQQAFSGLNEQQRNDMGDLAMKANVALSQGPEAYSKFITDNKDRLNRVGANADWMIQTGIQNPEQLSHMLTTMTLGAVGPDKMLDYQDKMVGREIDRGRLAETIRSNQAGEALTARGQNITMRGQDLSASTARRGQDLAMQRASTRGTAGNDERTVQLSDGRTVTVGGKLHGAGANAFYEGIDNEGNMVRVPAGSIAAPATSAASAQNYAMKKDLDAISGASIDDLGFMTGITGSSGSPALGADIRSRASGGDQRKLYNAAQRIQGKMQNQGIAAARDMGASGINTVAEAKMYFQGMPQVDFSSPEALQQSMRDIQQYTDNYNQQYNVNVGKSQRQQSQPTQVSQPAASSNFSSLWGD
ncbi:DNA transfer protein [Salmonella enterica subsp. enterica serovar Lubbock]|uniref:DNA transfer protein n=1 Tax=Salmonella enterica subsp. enterica serovar Lubbock TaxID=2077273 RepID=A0A6C8LLG0_SALET|nr:DNA transfer protein [Salmonella enterica]EBH9556764.1 DNA transfer protein [Salmonella enterica subsp. enterica serovar Cerro]AYJ55475.1 DNA transfer protein [Salmonella enterica subsp. enterica serovar Mbandaka]AYJ64761.1 DNA transfer protein [Salmonella enterica subsp. enterica serovar Lubbock]AYJ69668.1 DNA transfer protein [Salmonella enterica subsp. enterica serovar Lubbock]EAB0138040.1 DNA transfer protein [Salmonella enterica subsp. enterica serovar Mbandaka]